MASQVKGIHRVKKTLSGGRKVEYHYAWRGGPRFWDSKTAIQKGGAGYWAAYHEAVQSRRSDTGQFRQVIVDFLESREFASKAERTRKDYEKSIRHPQGIDATFGDAPIAAFNRPEIRRVAYTWRDKFASPRVADHFKGHLSAIVS